MVKLEQIFLTVIKEQQWEIHEKEQDQTSNLGRRITQMAIKANN